MLFKNIGLKEGEVWCKYLESRLIRNNKNILSAELGATGSGKSYRDLRKAELWYQYYFKKPFPVENICFGLEHTMKLISSGKLVRGDLIIVEEAGVNLGSLDFQTKAVKLFNYVLQSFRTMNIGLLFNLPYLSMLSKQARQLLHYSSESVEVNNQEGTNECKTFRHQVSQSTGKIYRKYFIVKTSTGSAKVKRMIFNKPSQYIIDAYESKKQQYLTEQNTDFYNQIKTLNNKGRKPLTEFQNKVKELYDEGFNQYEIAEKLNRTQGLISTNFKLIRNKGFPMEKRTNYNKSHN